MNNTIISIRTEQKLHIFQPKRLKSLLREPDLNFNRDLKATFFREVDSLMENEVNQTEESRTLSYLAMKQLMRGRWRTFHSAHSYANIQYMLADLKTILSTSLPRHSNLTRVQVLFRNVRIRTRVSLSFLSMKHFMSSYIVLICSTFYYASKREVTAEIHEQVVICLLLVRNILGAVEDGTHNLNRAINKYLSVLEHCLLRMASSTYHSAVALGRVEGVFARWARGNSVDDIFYRYGYYQTCSICLGNITPTTDILGLDNCYHIFCKNCLLDWIRSS